MYNNTLIIFSSTGRSGSQLYAAKHMSKTGQLPPNELQVTLLLLPEQFSSHDLYLVIKPDCSVILDIIMT